MTSAETLDQIEAGFWARLDDDEIWARWPHPQRQRHVCYCEYWRFSFEGVGSCELPSVTKGLLMVEVGVPLIVQYNHKYP